MEELRFEHDDDFATQLHHDHREDVWIGGPYTEVVYLLSCLTRVNYHRTPEKVWYPAAQEFISAHVPKASWITRSHYFAEFAVLLLKDLYRQNGLAKRYPIRAERREERARRFALTNPEMTVEEIAVKLKTTVKQLQRNSSLQVARVQFERLKNQNSKV